MFTNCVVIYKTSDSFQHQKGNSMDPNEPLLCKCGHNLDMHGPRGCTAGNSDGAAVLLRPFAKRSSGVVRVARIQPDFPATCEGAERGCDSR